MISFYLHLSPHIPIIWLFVVWFARGIHFEYLEEEEEEKSNKYKNVFNVVHFSSFIIITAASHT